MTGNGCAILLLCSIILPKNYYPQLTTSDAISRNVRSKEFAVCESPNIPVYLPIDMYGVLQYQAHQIFLSICHKKLLVHYLWHDF